MCVLACPPLGNLQNMKLYYDKDDAFPRRGKQGPGDTVLYLHHVTATSEESVPLALLNRVAMAETFVAETFEDRDPDDAKPDGSDTPGSGKSSHDGSVPGPQGSLPPGSGSGSAGSSPGGAGSSSGAPTGSVSTWQRCPLLDLEPKELKHEECDDYLFVADVLLHLVAKNAHRPDDLFRAELTRYALLDCAELYVGNPAAIVRSNAGQTADLLRRGFELFEGKVKPDYYRAWTSLRKHLNDYKNPQSASPSAVLAYAVGGDTNESVRRKPAKGKPAKVDPPEQAMDIDIFREILKRIQAENAKMEPLEP
mmetsp:Transcript_7029/g.21391  ORF Transcript_7029/g.21391 Transcript_7029/m.21391 type:complete len:309 (-) Transcript_7029:665-1591(-)